jgi:hypothetical protein
LTGLTGELGPAEAPAPAVAFDASAPAAPPPDLGSRFASRRTLLSLVIAFALLAFFLHRQGADTLARSWQHIRHANLWLLVGALGTYYLAFPVRSARWRILLANSGEPPERIPKLRDLSEIIYLSWFANSIVPAKLGDVYRGWLLRRTGGASWSHAMGTIVAERALDIIVLVSLMVIAGLLTYGDVMAQGMSGGPVACLESGVHVEALGCTLIQLFTLGSAIVLVLILGLMIFARFGAHLERFLPGRLGQKYVTFSGALVLSFGRFHQLLLFSLVGWLIEGTSFWLVGQALGFDIPFALVIVFSLLQAFITIIPLTPGGLGFEIILATALTVRGYSPAAAVALTLVYRAISYLSLVIGGSVVYTFSAKTK